MRLSWWWYHCAVVDHRLHNIRRQFLRILACFAPVVPIAIHTCPYKQREMQYESKELHHYTCEFNTHAMRLCVPQCVDVSILFGAVFEPGVIVIRRIRRGRGLRAVAAAIIRRVLRIRAVLPHPRPVILKHIFTVTTPVAAEIATFTPVHDIEVCSDGEERGHDEAEPEEEVEGDAQTGVHGPLAQEEDEDAGQAPDDADAERYEGRPEREEGVVAIVAVAEIIAWACGADPAYCADTDEAGDYGDGLESGLEFPVPVGGVELLVKGRGLFGRGGGIVRRSGREGGGRRAGRVRGRCGGCCLVLC